MFLSALGFACMILGALIGCTADKILGVAYILLGFCMFYLQVKIESLREEREKFRKQKDQFEDAVENYELEREYTRFIS